MRRGFPLEKGESEMAIADNRGYVKQTTAKVLGILMAQDPASAKSKLLFLIPPHIY